MGKAIRPSRWMRGTIHANLRSTMKKQPAKSSAKAPLRLLGKASALPTEPSRDILDSFPNSHPGRDYTILLETEDFSSVCPVTGQPDYAEIDIEYIPAARCIETKSLKYYLASFRNTPAFNEQIVNRILEDLVATCSPKRMTVRGAFASRGGLSLTVEATHTARGKKR
jgi:7-cyano-7-deazaguanine reductase